MTEQELNIARNAAFMAFDKLKKGEGIDISKTKIYAYDKQYMLDLCEHYIYVQRLAGEDTHVMSEDYTIIKRI